MKPFIPEEKLSKKAKKELAKAGRTVWERSPVTRRVESKKIYNRKRAAREPYESPTGGVFVLGMAESFCPNQPHFSALFFDFWPFWRDNGTANRGRYETPFFIDAAKACHSDERIFYENF